MIKIRLSRGGTKKRPVYKVVIADSRRARDGRFIEKVGFFNPLLPKDKKERVGLEAERIKYWLGQGAQPTARVARILGENDIIPMPANANNPNKAIPKKERKKEGEEAPKAEAPKQKLLKQKLLRKKLLKQKLQKQKLLKQKLQKQKLLKQKLLKQKLQKKKLQRSKQKLLKQKLQKQKLQKQKLLKQKLLRKKLNSWIHVASSDIHTLPRYFSRPFK